MANNKTGTDILTEGLPEHSASGKLILGYPDGRIFVLDFDTISYYGNLPLEEGAQRLRKFVTEHPKEFCDWMLEQLSRGQSQ